MDRPTVGHRRPTFLVERYWPGVDLALVHDVVARIEATARAMTAEGTPVEHVGSILMPADQVVFSLVAAADESLVRRLNERAELPADRIGAAIALPPGGISPPPDLHEGATR